MNALAAIILAAGKGTRMKSNRAKVAFSIAGVPMIQRVINTAVKVNCENIAVVVGYQKEAVIGCIEDDDRLVFIEQKEQLGTGHAVMITEENFKNFSGDILILCGDVPLLSDVTIKKLYDKHLETKAVCTVLTAVLEDAGKYGRIMRDEHDRIKGIVEYKDATPSQRWIKEFNTGIYIFNAAEMYSALKQTSNANQQGEYYLTDTLGIFYSQNKTISHMLLDDLTEVSGVNSQEQLAELEDSYIDKIRKYWLNNGVVMHNPSTIYIEDDVVIEPDVEIGQNTILKGKTYLETGSVIGPSCYLDNCKVGTESILQGFNVMINAIIHDSEIIEFQESHEEDMLYEQ
ncbi:MAG TPA: sugar phosphate nucleotidyltransferase [Candidatus Cloacimonadota bacterium]|nr:sugar phosphate nucleotidyltransferase [Candidatus Cloacimonadota bacterium]